MDNFNTLSQRLLNRAPSIGIVLAQQLVNDSWHTLQARREWNWRRKSGTFAPPTLYQEGMASTNASTGNPFLITGVNTAWTTDMIGRQIRIGGLNYQYYDITGYLSPTQLIIGQPWAGPDLTNQAYQILQCFFPVPDDFGYFEWCVSLKDAFKLYTQTTQSELAVWDPQRTNQGQTFTVSFRDFSASLGGIIGPVIPVTSPASPAPISTTTLGYSYPANATYIVQVVTGGIAGVATWQWLRSGQTAFQPAVISDESPQDLSDGVQIYWPDGQTYAAGDLFVINCVALLTQGVPRYELWPTPSFNGYLYPYQYITRESDLTPQQPTLPPQVASRGELLLEMALEKCALFPGQDMDHPNLYYSLQLAKYHRERYEDMMIEFENNDQNIGENKITYEDWPYGGGVWDTGSWRQHHGPLLY